MTTYAKTDSDACGYFTAGKLYEVIREAEETGEFWIRDDDGDMITCYWHDDYLIGENNIWQRVEVTE